MNTTPHPPTSVEPRLQPSVPPSPCANPKCQRPFTPVRPWHRFCKPACRVVDWKLRN